MGKIPDVRSLVLHQWKKPGNVLVSFGRRTNRLDGSILSSALGITGTKLDDLVFDPAHYLNCLYWLSRSGMISSAVPINRGGMILRLFEGVEASGFGVNTMLCEELFMENFGGVLVEVKKEAVHELLALLGGINPIVVGTIMPRKEMIIQDRQMNLALLRKVWIQNFRKALWENAEEVTA
jgi:phosphoribosylformylglycinamidine (FGAM) synthase-like enzyme